MSTLLRTQCPSCGKIHQAPAEYRGRLVRCRDCRDTFPIKPIVPVVTNGSAPPQSEFWTWFLRGYAFAWGFVCVQLTLIAVGFVLFFTLVSLGVVAQILGGIQ